MSRSRRRSAPRRGRHFLFHLAGEVRCFRLALRAGYPLGNVADQRNAVEVGRHVAERDLVVDLDLGLAEADARQIDRQRLHGSVARIGVVDEGRRSAGGRRERRDPAADLQGQQCAIGAGQQQHADGGLGHALAAYRQSRQDFVHLGIFRIALGDQAVEQFRADGDRTLALR